VKIEFIIPTFVAINNLILILQCLIVQNNKNWKANVVIDGYTDLYDEIKEFYKNENRICFTHIKGPDGYFGHNARNYGVQNATEEWLLMTSDDNYYVPTFVDEVLKVIDNNTRFIYCDMIHNGYGYKVFECHHSSHNIDIGNMIMKSEFAKQLKLDKKRLDADGIMCGEYIDKFCKEENNVKKINSILYVHN